MTLGVLLFIGLHASAKCLDYQPGQTLLASVQNYLSAQFWQDNQGSYWQLEADGSLYIWSESAQRYTTGRWSVSHGALMPALEVVFDDHVLQYAILPDCEHLSLATLSGSAEELLQLTPAAVGQGTLAAQLAGEWQSAYLGGYCQLTFSANGSLKASRQSDKGLQNMQGRWVLGRDGRTVFFHLNGCSRVEIISIRYLEMDEMVVRPVCDSLLVNVGADCYFNKL